MNDLKDLARGMVHFGLVRHADWCRAQRTQKTSDCVCNAQVEFVTRDVWEATMSRDARRRAAKKARRQGGGK